MAVGAQERLPKVTLKDLEGRTVQTDTISNNGNPLVVTFFATWCKPCDRELKSIDELYYDVLLDPNGEFLRSFGIQSVPYTILLDGQGRIVYKHNGYTDGAEMELYKKVKEVTRR